MKKRSLTAKTLLLAFGKILAAFATLGIGAVLTRSLSLEDFATHKQALMTFAILAPVLSLGMPKALYFFLPGETDRPRSILIENLMVLAVLGVLFCVMILLGGDHFFVNHFDNPKLADVLPIVAFYGLFMIPLGATGAALMARDRVEKLVVFQLSTQALLVLAVATTAIVFRTPKATITAYLVWSGVALIIGLLLMLKVTQQSTPLKLQFSGIKNQLRYGIPLGLAAMFGSISAQLDKYMVSVLCSTEDFAIYVAGAVELPLIGVITGAMNAVVLPELAKFFKAGKLNEIRLLWQRAMNKSILILAPATFIVLLFGTELITLIFSARYAEAATPMRIYALALPIRAAVYGSVLMATNKTKWVTGAAIFGLFLNAVLNYWLVGLFGYAGAAWATVATTYGVVLVLLYPLCKALKTNPAHLFDWKHLSRVMFACAVPAAFAYWCMAAIELEGLTRLFVGTGLYGLTVLLAYRLLRITTIRELISFLRKRKA